MDRKNTHTPRIPADVDFDRDIHYALKAESLQWHVHDDRRVPMLCWPIFGQFRMLLLPMSMLFVFGAILYFPLPVYVTGVLCAIAAALMLTPIILRGRRAKREYERLKPEYAPLSNQRHRLRVAGPPPRLKMLQEAMARETDEFEPRVFRVGRARRRKWVDGIVVLVLFCLILLALFLLKSAIGLRASIVNQAIVFCSMALTFVVWAFLWPTYLRLVPGRLDILSYSILGRGRPSVQSFDLTEIKVLVMIPGSALLFLPDKPAHLIDVGPSLIESEPLAFERAMLAAALSRAPAPQLPDDDLVG